jgi:glutathione synthase/RimK-type ligase-like ATP-grasp enzyme
VINWGSSTSPSRWKWTTTDGDINNPLAVTLAANKYHSFRCFKENDVPTPDWTIDRDEAQAWINDGDVVIVRHLLSGHSGQGIEVVQEGVLPHAPLYTKYKKKRAEYRVHVFKGEVIDTVQKKNRNSEQRPENFSTFIRSHATGWVFCRDGVTPSDARDATAIAAVRALCLDFGAVDIIYNELENKYYVLEVNSAPGIQGSTLDKYVEAIYENI